MLEAGVTLIDPDRIDIRGELICGRDVEIDVGCIFEGRVELADGVRVGAYSVICNAKVVKGLKYYCSAISMERQSEKLLEWARILVCVQEQS